MLKTYDSRRMLYQGENEQDAITFAVEHFLKVARQAIQQTGKFSVALSGGSTPKAIYQELAKIKDFDWTKVFLFWSDERAVPPDSKESNYNMAIEYFGKLPIPKHQIFRMKAESEIEKNAKDYEEKIHHYLGKDLFDLVMLGVGEDGHTASLFPHTQALQEEKLLVVANDVPQKQTKRMTLTFRCINESKHIAIYALGKSKKEILDKVLNAPIISFYPASRIGTEKTPALWIVSTYTEIG